MLVAVVAILYVVSVIGSYLSTQWMFSQEKKSPITLDVILVFIPLLNLATPAVCVLEVLNRKNLAMKFFKIKN